MDVAAFVISIFALVVAVGSAIYTRRQALAQERSATADESSAQAATAALAIEHERSDAERRQREDQNAPRFAFAVE
jgi:hypothetical protein